MSLIRRLGRGRLLAKRRLFDVRSLPRNPREENEAAIRALCASAYLGDHTALCRVLGRYKMFVDTRDVGLSSHLLLDGYWEMWLTEVLATIVRPGMHAIDVGANLGYFSIVMGELVGPRGRVTAFEPNPRLNRLLRRSVSANGFDDHVTVHSIAAGDINDARYHLIVADDDPKNGFVVPALSERDGGPTIVEGRRLDSFAELLDVDVVKIDADTAERAIWEGMAGIFDRNRSMTVLLEFNLARYNRPDLFLAEIATRGFRLARLDLDTGVQPCSHEDIFQHPAPEDQMLILSR